MHSYLSQGNDRPVVVRIVAEMDCAPTDGLAGCDNRFVHVQGVHHAALFQPPVGALPAAECDGSPLCLSSYGQPVNRGTVCVRRACPDL